MSVSVLLLSVPLALQAVSVVPVLADSPRPPVFRITPLRPVEDLRREARAATPPAEKGPFRPSDLVDVAALDATIRLDVRYATPENFLG